MVKESKSLSLLSEFLWLLPEKYFQSTKSDTWPSWCVLLCSINTFFQCSLQPKQPKSCSANRIVLCKKHKNTCQPVWYDGPSAFPQLFVDSGLLGELDIMVKGISTETLKISLWCLFPQIQFPFMVFTVENIKVWFSYKKITHGLFWYTVIHTEVLNNNNGLGFE